MTTTGINEAAVSGATYTATIQYANVSWIATNVNPSANVALNILANGVVVGTGTLSGLAQDSPWTTVTATWTAESADAGQAIQLQVVATNFLEGPGSNQDWQVPTFGFTDATLTRVVTINQTLTSIGYAGNPPQMTALDQFGNPMATQPAFNAGTITITSPLALTNNITVLAAAGRQLTISGGISGTGQLGVNGTGTVVLSGANHYTGGTEVTAGRLVVDNASAIAAGTSLTVGAGAAALFRPLIPMAYAPAVAASTSQAVVATRKSGGRSRRESRRRIAGSLQFVAGPGRFDRRRRGRGEQPRSAARDRQVAAAAIRPHCPYARSCRRPARGIVHGEPDCRGPGLAGKRGRKFGQFRPRSKERSGVACLGDRVFRLWPISGVSWPRGTKT